MEIGVESWFKRLEALYSYLRQHEKGIDAIEIEKCIGPIISEMKEAIEADIAQAPYEFSWPIYIDVENGKITDIWYDTAFGLEGMLSKDKYRVEYRQTNLKCMRR